MADFGQLDSFIDEYDLKFSWEGTEYEWSYPLQAVLELRKINAEAMEAGKLSKDGETEQDAILRVTAPLLGSKYDAKTKKIKGGLLEQLMTTHDNFGWKALDRLITSVYSSVRWGDTVAEKFAESGDLGKALGLDKIQENMRKAAEEDKKTLENGNSDSQPTKETQPTAGETDGEDSDET